MATRSRIAIENQDGTVTSIYCHFDGYLSGVGKLLKRGTLIGKQATVKYFELTTDGIPRFPKVIAIRDFE